MGFLNIAIILRILLGFFQVIYAIFRDLLGFWDFSNDFIFCMKIFRVIYPSQSSVKWPFDVLVYAHSVDLHQVGVHVEARWFTPKQCKTLTGGVSLRSLYRLTPSGTGKDKYALFSP
jgi:hypothetical protein